MKAPLIILALTASVSWAAIKEPVTIPHKEAIRLFELQRNELDILIDGINQKLEAGLKANEKTPLKETIKRLKPLIEEKAKLQNRLQALDTLLNPAIPLKLYADPIPKGRPLKFNGEIYHFMPLENGNG